MKLYKQKTNDCWRIALCNLLHLSPAKVPHFVKKYKDDFIKETRKWLNERGKSLVYVPLCDFLESGIKYNPPFFPEGRCLALMDSDDVSHACLMIDGELFEKGGRDYSDIFGYFLVYDLE